MSPVPKSLYPNLVAIRDASPIRCPDCDVRMQLFSCSNVVVDKCPRCHGIWFDAREIGVFRNTLESRDLRSIRVLAPETDETLVIRACPRDGNGLTPFTYGYNSKVKLHRCDRCDGLWSPFSEILHLVDHARISQSIEPEVRALGRELLRHHSIVERWRSAGRVGEVLNQPVRWIHLIFYRPFGIVLPLGTDAVSSGATPVEPYGTLSIAVACGVAFVAAGGDPIRWSMVPARVFSGEGLASPLTALFMHSGLLHLLGNLFFLWLFGAAVEARLGVLRFLALYFGAGIAANAIDLAAHAASTVPRLGSDGAVSAVLGAYLFLFPSASVRTFFFGAIADLPAWLYLGGWIVFQAVLARSVPVWGFVLGGAGAWVLAAASRRPGQRFRT